MVSDGRRQPSRGGTSRMSREAHVRICERLGVQFPGATRLLRAVINGGHPNDEPVGPRWGKVEPALRRRRRSHSPTAPRCLRAARYGRTTCDLRRTGFRPLLAAAEWFPLLAIFLCVAHDFPLRQAGNPQVASNIAALPAGADGSAVGENWWGASPPWFSCQPLPEFTL